MIGGLIIATMVCIALSGFCFIGNQYDLLPSFILDAGHYEFVNVLYCLFAIASFLCALIAYRLYKREKEFTNGTHVPTFMDYIRANQSEYEKLFEEYQGEEEQKSEILVPSDVKDKLEEEDRQKKQQQIISPTLDVKKIGEGVKEPEKQEIQTHSASEVAHVTVPSEPAPVESLPPISVPVFKAKSISTVTTKTPVAAEPKPEPIVPPPPILPKVSVAPKKVSEKVSDALPPFDLAVQALKSAGVSEALYAVNEKKEGAVCSLHSQSEWFIFNYEEDCLADKTVITIRCDDEDFQLTGTINVAKGWLQYEPFGQKDKEVPPLNDGESVPVDFKPVKKQTTPPKRFTVASFGAWCNAPWRNEDDSEKTDYTDEEWKRILHEATICTDATRTPTITECRNVGYIKLSKGTYSPDTKGYQFIDACEKLGLTFTVREVMDLSMMLFDVRKGTRTIDECVKTAMEKLNLMFTHKNAEVENLRPENTPICKCPKCGGNIIEWKESYSCSNKGCPAVVWKHSKVLEKINGKKKTFSKKDAIALFSGKPVSDKGCVSQKTGKTYDCLLYLDLTGEKAQMKITFDSAASTGKSVGVCPVCGKKMVERPNSFSCENSSCGFTIWKETKRFSDILKIDAEKAKQLLDGKGVPFELTNKKNEKYTTNLLLTVSVYNGKHYPKFDLPVKPPKKY